EKREAAAGVEHADGAEARLGYARRQLADAERMVESFVRLAARLRPPPEAGWGALTDWASRLHADLLPAGSGWPPLEHEAGQLVDEILRELAAAEAVEPAVSAATFAAALEAALARRRQPEGRLGHGVVVGPAVAAAGMAF